MQVFSPAFLSDATISAKSSKMTTSRSPTPRRRHPALTPNRSACPPFLTTSTTSVSLPRSIPNGLATTKVRNESREVMVPEKLS